MKSSHVTITRWTTLVTSSILVAVMGILIVGQQPHVRDNAAHLLGITPKPLATSPGSFIPRAMPSESFDVPPGPPLPDLGRQPERSDNIVVEVGPDGALCVAGELMEIEGFREFLSDDAVQSPLTYVTIQPHDDCVFRHISPVISVCEEHGIPHNTAASRGHALPGLIRAGL